MGNDEVLNPTRVLFKTPRGHYKTYLDSRRIQKRETMIKKITTTIKHNKKEIQKRAIVIGGTAIGAFIAGVILAKAEAPFEGIVVVEEDIPMENEGE